VFNRHCRTRICRNVSRFRASAQKTERCWNLTQSRVCHLRWNLTQSRVWHLHLSRSNSFDSMTVRHFLNRQWTVDVPACYSTFRGSTDLVCQYDLIPSCPSILSLLLRAFKQTACSYMCASGPNSFGPLLRLQTCHFSVKPRARKIEALRRSKQLTRACLSVRFGSIRRSNWFGV
jgi:hypothetical protein